ncbi:unnamed protein product, partial [marine sediment metagenome]
MGEFHTEHSIPNIQTGKINRHVGLSSGKYFNVVFYGVDKETETIDYDQVLKIARECKPKLIVCGASAYPRIIDFKRFKEIADEVGAYLLADIAHIAGLIAAKLHPDPIPYCDF